MVFIQNYLFLIQKNNNTENESADSFNAGLFDIHNITAIIVGLFKWKTRCLISTYLSKHTTIINTILSVNRFHFSQ